MWWHRDNGRTRHRMRPKRRPLKESARGSSGGRKGVRTRSAAFSDFCPNTGPFPRPTRKRDRAGRGAGEGRSASTSANRPPARTMQTLKIRSSADISGVSAYPWIVSTVSQVFWLGYGISASNLVVAAHAPFAMTANLVLLLALHNRRAGAETRPGRA